jgi:hypothetical protein
MSFSSLSSLGIVTYILLSQFWDSQLGGPVPVFNSLRNRVAQLYSRHRVCVIHLHVTTRRIYSYVYTVYIYIYICWASLSPGTLEPFCPIRSNFDYNCSLVTWSAICLTAAISSFLYSLCWSSLCQIFWIFEFLWFYASCMHNFFI